MSHARRRAGLGALLLLAGCAAPGTDLEALPFYREDRTAPQPDRVAADVPLLLLTVDAGKAPRIPHASPTGRPEASPADEAAAEADREEEFLLLRILWPLFDYQRRGEHSTFTFSGLAAAATTLANSGPAGRLASSDAEVRQDLIANLADEPASGGLLSLPLLLTSQEVDHNAIPDAGPPDLDADIALMPFFAWGSGSDPDHDYLAVFPFGGTTRGIWGKQAITWYGFPWPVYAEVKDRAWTSTHILWPLINFQEGPRHEGFRVLPFYGHYEARDSRGRMLHERTFLLWPFVTWQTTGMNEPAGPTETVFVLPFYGSISGPEREQTTVLWPFFRWEVDRRLDTWEVRAPFPILIFGGGPNRWRFDLWPLFGIKERPGFHRHFLVWPIWHYEAMETADGRSFSGQWLLPLFWRTHWEEAATGREETRLRVWPLLHYRALRDGSVDLALLSPFWQDSPGFERTLGSFFRLYRYHRDPEGGVEHQALLGLFSWRDLPEVPGRQAYSRLSLLFGMIHFRVKGQERGLRLLWLPELTWGGGDEES